MKISVTPGDVQVASVEVRQHTGGIYTVHISTPKERRIGLGFGRISERYKNVSQVLLYPENYAFQPPAIVELTPESNDEEEALFEGLFDVLESFAARYSVTLIAIPASVLEEGEEAGSWEPQGPIDYLATS